MGRQIPVVLFSLFLFSPLTAQTFKILPSYCAGVEGNAGENLIAGTADMRKQVFYERAAIAKTKAVITALAFRRDSKNPNPFKAHQVHRRVMVDTVTTYTSFFAKNLTLNAVKVFESTNLVFPATPPCTVPPAPFTAFIPFTRAYLYDPAKGNLLIDLLGRGIPHASQEWYVDNHFQNYGRSGMVVAYGAGCTGIKGEYLRGKVTNYQLYIGGSLSFAFTHNLSRPTNLLAWVGMSRTRFAGINLPLALDFLGATRCTLHASMEITLPVTATGGAFPPLVLPLPNNPALALTPVFCQGAALAPRANPAGLVFCRSQHCLIWPARRPPTELMSISAASSTAKSGAACYTPEGPVTKLYGSFN